MGRERRRQLALAQGVANPEDTAGATTVTRTLTRVGCAGTQSPAQLASRSHPVKANEIDAGPLHAHVQHRCSTRPAPVQHVSSTRPASMQHTYYITFPRKAAQLPRSHAPLNSRPAAVPNQLQGAGQPNQPRNRPPAATPPRLPHAPTNPLQPHPTPPPAGARSAPASKGLPQPLKLVFTMLHGPCINAGSRLHRACVHAFHLPCSRGGWGGGLTSEPLSEPLALPRRMGFISGGSVAKLLAYLLQLPGGWGLAGKEASFLDIGSGCGHVRARPGSTLALTPTARVLIARLTDGGRAAVRLRSERVASVQPGTRALRPGHGDRAAGGARRLCGRLAGAVAGDTTKALRPR